MWNSSMALVGNANPYQSQVADRLATILKGEGPSIAEDKDLQKCMSQDYDIVTWLSSNSIANYQDAQLMVTGMGFDPDALKNNYVHAYLNFEKGAVVGHSDFHLRKALTKDLDLVFKDEVKADFSPYVPAENLSAAFSLALDFKGINQILAERPQSKGFLNYALKEYDLTVSDIAKALGGDMLVGIYGAESDNPTHALFMTDIDNEKIFQKFLDFGLEHGVMKKTEDGYYLLNSQAIESMKPISPGRVAFEKAPVYMMIAHQMAFISNDRDLLETIQSGGFAKADRLPKTFSEQIGQHLLSGLVDFEQFDQFDEEVEDFPMKKMNFKAGRKSSDMKVEMKDGQNNSLKTPALVDERPIRKKQTPPG